nr:unnamed protein product [Digitaria exilis]
MPIAWRGTGQEGGGFREQGGRSLVVARMTIVAVAVCTPMGRNRDEMGRSRIRHDGKEADLLYTVIGWRPMSCTP